MSKITVTKLTDIELLHKANSFTTGKESHMSLAKAYASGHSNIRTQLFFLELRDIPAFVVGHLVRHVHAQPYVQSKRVDRGNIDFREECAALVDALEAQVENIEDSSFPYTRDVTVDNINNAIDIIKHLPEHFDRYAPQSVALLLNAEEIINISHARLCAKASTETREIWTAIVAEIAKIDPDLARHCVKPCVLYQRCREQRCCGFIHTEQYRKEVQEFNSLFPSSNLPSSDKQWALD